MGPTSRRRRFVGFPPLRFGCPTSRRGRFVGFPPLLRFGRPTSRRGRFVGFPPLRFGRPLFVPWP